MPMAEAGCSSTPIPSMAADALLGKSCTTVPAIQAPQQVRELSWPGPANLSRAAPARQEFTGAPLAGCQFMCWCSHKGEHFPRAVVTQH